MQNQTNFNWAFITCAMICKGYGWLAALRFAIWRFNERVLSVISVALCLNRMGSNTTVLLVQHQL